MQIGFVCKMDLHSECFQIAKFNITTAAYIYLLTEVSFWTTDSRLAAVQMKCQKRFIHLSEAQIKD